ncbi:hypothetical protein ACM01_44990 [Streptomyces viridochromogenes]|uniref:Uncharacterized protein n=1 Tax=Streptomyces viridochromogenes TaxID=1938 RepID=A0A0J8BMH2_STRVR|nr:hypothetical protein [Streptomyces viridochromogenes]KMS66790.1 hypothetical protein ACM01_44990 [Streptomyces viridochromogenes]
MATGGWGPGPGAGQPGGNGPSGQGWGAPYGPTPNDPNGPNNPYGPTSGGHPYGPPAPNPYPNQNPYPHPQAHPYPYPHPYGPPPAAPARAQRRSGCLWYVSPFYWAVAVIRSAHRVATKLFVHQSGDRILDRTVDRVQVARTVLGALATIGLILVYGVEKDRWNSAAETSFANAIVTPFLLICTGPLVILGFIYYAPPHLRPQLRSRLRFPLKAVGWYLLALAVIAAIIYAVGASGIMESQNRWVVLPVAFVTLAAIFWGLPFLFLASLYSARSAFNTAHVHPMLPPIVTGVLVWVLAIFNLISEGMPQGPPVAQFCSLLGGPLSVTAVSAWEMWRLRTRFGVTVRG